jgi:hypothetical protein
VVTQTASGSGRGGDLTFSTAAKPAIHLKPGTVTAGHSVRVYGSAGGCPEGDRVTLLSRAFSGTHRYAGLPAVYAKVKANGSYSLATTIPTGRHGRYSVTGRCGGGTLGVTAHLSVIPAAAPPFTG